MARAFEVLNPERPFWELNCAAMPEGILEAELFGVERTIATDVKIGPGLLASADGGTLLLDEIAEMPLAVQAKLLHALSKIDEGVVQFRPIGGTTLRRSCVRIISATNADLIDRCSKGRFSSDLYARLAGHAIRIPREDVYAILSGLAASKGWKLKFDSTAKRLLDTYRWPLNVREVRGLFARLQPDEYGVAWITIGVFPEPMLAWARQHHVGRAPTDPVTLPVSEGGLDQALDAYLLSVISYTAEELGGPQVKGIMLKLGKRLLGPNTSSHTAIGKRVSRALEHHPILWDKYPVIQALWPRFEPKAP